MAVVINGDTGISPVTASGTSASVDGMTVGRGGGEVSTNTAVGASVLNANTTGANNTALGYQSLYTNITGVNNVAIGGEALKLNTTDYCTAVGYRALLNNSTGARNSAFGHYAGNGNTTGGYNTFIGSYAGESNTTGSNNTALGYFALDSNTTASYNTATGYQAGYSNLLGSANTFLGYQAGYSFAAGSAASTYNTFLGYSAGYSVTTGTKNTIIGTYSGNQSFLDMRTLSNHIVLSDGDGNMRGWFNSSGQLFVNTGNVLSQTGIATFVGSANTIITQAGNGSAAFQSTNTSGTGTYYGAIWGNNGNSFSTCGTVAVSGTTTAYNTSSDYRLKEDVQPMTGALAKVALLKPVTYKWKSDGTDGEGFIAHELAEVCPNAVTGEKDAVKEDNSIMPQGIDTSFLVATLTAAIQELKAEFDAYKATHP